MVRLCTASVDGGVCERPEGHTWHIDSDSRYFHPFEAGPEISGPAPIATLISTESGPDAFTSDETEAGQQLLLFLKPLSVTSRERVARYIYQQVTANA